MKTLFTIFLLLFSVSLFAAANANDNDTIIPTLDGNPVTMGTTGSTGASTVGTTTGTTVTTTPNTEEATTPMMELSTDGYKATFKGYKLQQKMEKVMTKDAIKKDAKELGQKVEVIIKACKAKMFAASTQADYTAQNICFANKIITMDEGKHKFILSTIVAQCEAAWGSNGALEVVQRKYLCYRNALRAALKTSKGLVIGWGAQEQKLEYDLVPIEKSQIESGETTPQ